MSHSRELPDPVVRAQLEKILASDVFSRSPQLRRFLSFIVEQRLAGQGQSLKEAVLAHELYGKGTEFDGGADPVVRVDARRLRDKLREYYDGRSEPVVITLPKGSYVPVFTAAATAPEDDVLPLVPAAPQQTRRLANLSRAKIAAGAAILAAVIVGPFAWRTGKPVIAPTLPLPLAPYPGVKGAPALSPDGNLVAFAWSGNADEGPTDIYVKAVEGEALRQLTATPASETGPAWSPDGHTIAFVRSGQGVFTISQLGGTERQVSASGTHVAWAGHSRAVLIRDREADTRPFGIYQVSLETLDRRQLTQAPVGAGDWRFDVSRTAARWRSSAMKRWESPTSTSSPSEVENHGGSRTGTPRSKGCRGRRMAGTSSTPSMSRRRAGCGESPRTRPRQVGAHRLPTFRCRPRIRRSRGPCPAGRRASRFKRSPATSTFS